MNDHPGPMDVEVGADGEQRVHQLLVRLQGPVDLATLLSLWQTPPRDRDHWFRNPEVHRRLGEKALELHEDLLAYDVICEGLAYWKGDACLRQLQGRALARNGAPHLAREVLEALRAEGHDDAVTLGGLGRVYKDLGLLATAPAERDEHLGRALAFYDDAYRRDGDVWPGINVATLLVLLGRKDQARARAREVRQKCLETLRRFAERGADPFWPKATLGEAALILGDDSDAETWYAQLSEVGLRRLGDLDTTRRNARLLAEHLDVDWERINRCFRIPRVAVFAGHMIDRPGRATPRFPAEIERAVYAAILERLKRWNARVGFSSAACGSDILFQEAIRELGGEAHVVLPYNESELRKDSVEIIPGSTWGGRFEAVLAAAAEVTTASPQRLELGGVSYEYDNLILHGLAMIRGRQLSTEVIRMAVWDGRPGDGPGGTASTVERWRALGHQVEQIDLAEILRQCPGVPARVTGVSAGEALTWPDTPGTEPTPAFASQIVAILFADVVGFSKLKEWQIPLFVDHFLGMVATLVKTSPHAPVKKNTWGDGLYFIFENVRDAGNLALDLCDRVAGTDWADKGLILRDEKGEPLRDGKGQPKGLNLRVALHAGPVYSCKDPVTERPNCIGTHVSHTARIEPITPPGLVYASHAFAALAVSEGIDDFACHYVGRMPYAKDYGVFPTYHVSRGL
jgi:class 3 adenylate cyclase/tetratricopeptide (TPR) repeat protein